MTIRVSAYAAGLLLIVAIALTACNEQRDQPYQMTYDFEKPTKVFELPAKLKEISGMTPFGENRIACIQDEKGSVLLIGTKKWDLKESVEFGKDGDYEGIAAVGDTLYVLRSSGAIIEINHFDTDSQTATMHDLILTKRNNTEGLTYDKKNNRLLIACKDNAGADDKSYLPEKFKAVYAFDLATKTMDPKPVLLLNTDSMLTYVKRYNIHRKGEMSDDVETHAGEYKFAPSDLAVHPTTGDYYIISSVGRLLVVLSPAGTIRYIAELNPEIFKQPEGITFIDGDMYVSNEGRNGKAHLLIFKHNDQL